MVAGVGRDGREEEERAGCSAFMYFVAGISSLNSSSLARRGISPWTIVEVLRGERPMRPSCLRYGIPHGASHALRRSAARRTHGHAIHAIYALHADLTVRRGRVVAVFSGCRECSAMDGSADGSSASREAAICAKNQPWYGGLVRQLSRDLV